MVFLVPYIDDILLIGNNVELLTKDLGGRQLPSLSSQSFIYLFLVKLPTLMSLIKGLESPFLPVLKLGLHSHLLKEILSLKFGIQY